MASREFAMRK